MEVGLSCAQQQSQITIIAFTSGENGFERSNACTGVRDVNQFQGIRKAIQ